ncbi:MAG: DeoR/GlpR family DNA-binding transcription regulator [Solibacillus sp.]
MYPVERQQKIMEIVRTQQVVKHSELTEALQISMETLRRDIQILVQQGLIEKFYGGIREVAQSLTETLIEQRMIHQLDEKIAIARECAKLIHEGDCIFLDSGSSTFQIAKFIRNMKNVTVITNSLPIAIELLHTSVEIILMGGKVRHSEKSIVAYDFLLQYDQLNISKAFICTSGISLKNGLSDFSFEEVLTRRNIVRIAQTIYVVADHTKFERDVAIKICSLSDVDYFITDAGLNEAIFKQYKHEGINVQRVGSV